MKTNLIFSCLLTVLLTSGCAGLVYISPKSVKPRDYQIVPSRRVLDPVAWTNAVALDGTSHSIGILPITNRPAIKWRQAMNPVWLLKNNDDPVPPPWYIPGHRFRKIKWFFRNIGHNATEVYGFQRTGSVRTGDYPEWITKPGGGLNVTIVAYGHIRSLGISYATENYEIVFAHRPDGRFEVKIRKRSEADKRATAVPVRIRALPPSSQ